MGVLPGRLVSCLRVVPAIALGVLLVNCAPEERVTSTPESTTRTIAAGGNGEVPMSVLLDDNGFDFVELPVDVRLVGLDSEVARVLTLHPDPISVRLTERDVAEEGIVNISVQPGTPPGEYHARIVPDSPNQFVDGGDGIDLTVIVPEGEFVPTPEPTSSGTPVPTVEPTPTETCTPGEVICAGECCDGDCVQGECVTYS